MPLSMRDPPLPQRRGCLNTRSASQATSPAEMRYTTCNALDPMKTVWATSHPDDPVAGARSHTAHPCMRRAWPCGGDTSGVGVHPGHEDPVTGSRNPRVDDQPHRPLAGGHLGDVAGQVDERMPACHSHLFAVTAKRRRRVPSANWAIASSSGSAAPAPLI